MKLTAFFSGLILLPFITWMITSCNNNSNQGPAINSLQLKRGQIIACGPPDKEFGRVDFQTALTGKPGENFDLAIALLHSFEYDEAEKMFAAVIDAKPEAAMAYWGVAMCNYHPLWSPPSASELEKGAKAVSIAQSLTKKSRRESDYINAIADFYIDWQQTDHRTRTRRFEKAMEHLYAAYPDDKEAAIFYSLALTAAADPSDKSFQNQKKAGTILNKLYAGQPDHPGVVHYIIHAYDSPELAKLALGAARKYAAVAPSSAHALHMPSHIFTRLGLWDECISSNLASVSSAQCYAQQTGINGHWDEELHGLDYLVYAYLQKGQNELAKKQLDYLRTIKQVTPANFKVAYAFAAIPSRYYLENKMWKEAARMDFSAANVKWEQHPWEKAIIHFSRLLGAVHTGENQMALDELNQLKRLRDSLLHQKDNYKAGQVEVQIKTGEAWMLFKKGQNSEGVQLMRAAADLEDRSEKHPVTPGEVIPARELLGDMLLEMNKPADALREYEVGLKKSPNRFNGLYGAALAAEKSGQREKAFRYYQHLNTVANRQSNRTELERSRAFLQ